MEHDESLKLLIIQARQNIINFLKVCGVDILIADNTTHSPYKVSVMREVGGVHKPKLSVEFFARFTKESKDEITSISKQAFLVLEKAWHIQGHRLVDTEVCFTFLNDGTLVLDDVFCNVLEDRNAGREGFIEKLRAKLDLTSKFSLPKQQILLWRGSEGDDWAPFDKALEKYFPDLVSMVTITRETCSAHKEPVRAYVLLQQHTYAFPDSAIIAYIGHSNGAGPTEAANTMCPVITVPKDFKEFPNDVWSSLRAPSNVPVLTVLNPQNALLAAFRILAMRNPAIYAILRMELENTLYNV